MKTEIIKKPVREDFYEVKLEELKEGDTIYVYGDAHYNGPEGELFCIVLNSLYEQRVFSNKVNGLRGNGFVRGRTYKRLEK